MNKMFDYIAAHSDWLVLFVPLLCVVVWFAIDSRWEAYSRRKNYEELKSLHELREKSIITQEEFDEKKRRAIECMTPWPNQSPELMRVALSGSRLSDWIRGVTVPAWLSFYR